MIEDELEDRRVAAERVKERREAEQQEEADLAREQTPADDAVPQDEDGRDGAGEQVVDRPVGPAALNERVEARAPIIVGPAQRAEHVAEQHRRQALRRQGTHGGDPEPESGPARRHQELHGEKHRDGEQGAAGDAHGEEHAGALAQIDEAPLGLRDAPDHGGDQSQRAQERDLVAPHRHGGGDDREHRAEPVGAAVERLLEQKQREREEPVADDHARVLQAGRGGAAQDEDHRGDDGAGRVPAAPAEQGQDGEGARQEMREHHDVEQLHGRRGHEPAEQQHGRREEKGLRIGDRRMAAEVIRVPERQLAMLDRRAEIAQHGIEVVLRIPRHDAAGEGPHEASGAPEGEHDKRCDEHVAAGPGALAGVTCFRGFHRRDHHGERARATGASVR